MCQKSEVFVKIKKKCGWGVRFGGGGYQVGGSGRWGVRVDVNEEFKFLLEIKKKK